MYIRRAAKYFVRLCVIYAVLLAVLYATDNASVPLPELSRAMFGTWRGAVLAGVSVVLSLAYPRFGFADCRVEGDFDASRDAAAEVMTAIGMRAVGETSDSMTFRAVSPLRRLRLLYDDEVRVSRCGGSIRIEGLRRVVLRAASHLEARIGGE
ncbi:MAG: hypothetical protein K2I43_06565 [Alistipes sp.]|nr:hypothetical protein [Alistipes sp.]